MNELADFILEELERLNGIQGEDVCDFLSEIPEEWEYCGDYCEFNCAQKECYLRYFLKRMNGI